MEAMAAAGPDPARLDLAPYTPPGEHDGSYSRDVYSYAVVVLACLTDVDLVDYESVARAQQKLNAPPDIKAILDRALSDDTAERQPNANILLAEIKAVQQKRDRKHRPRRPCFLELSAKSMAALRAETELNSDEAVHNILLEDLNTECGIVPYRLYNAPPGEEFFPGQYQVYGVSYRYHVKVKEPRCDCLMVFKVWRSPHSMLEQNRDRSWIPPYEFRFGQPLDVLESQDVIRELQLAVDEDQADRRAREAEEREPRLYLTWRGILQAKGDLEKARQSPLRYNGVRAERGRAFLQLLDPPGEDLVGQPRSIRLPNGHFLAGEVDDVRDRTLALFITLGDPNLAPRSGELLFDTRAAEAALDRQKAALDAVRFDRAARPDLGPLLLHPEKARTPNLGEEVQFLQPQLDDDKKEAVRAALATEDFLVVEGPPGTGKTTFIAEVVHQTLLRNPDARILLSSQTHVALDNALEKILDLGQDLKLLRVGRLGDEDVSPRVEALRLEDQMEKWGGQVLARGREFLDEFARARGVSQKAVEIAALFEQATAQLDVIKQLQVRIECRNREIEELSAQPTAANTPGPSRRPVINVQNAESLRLLKKDLTQFEKELKDARKAFEKTEARLQELGSEELGGIEPGELAAMTAKDLSELASAFIDPGDPNTATYKLLRRIHQEWGLRFARSEDFHAALLKRANVIAGTCIGIAGVKGMQDLRFDLCIVDEASKATATEVSRPVVPLAALDPGRRPAAAPALQGRGVAEAGPAPALRPGIVRPGADVVRPPASRLARRLPPVLAHPAPHGAGHREPD